MRGKRRGGVVSESGEESLLDGFNATVSVRLLSLKWKVEYGKEIVMQNTAT